MAELAEKSKVMEGIVNRFNSLNTSSDFHKNRKEAMDLLNTIGLPSPKNEEYKFTNITKILEKEFNSIPHQFNSKIQKEAIQKLDIEGLDVHKLVFINGVYSSELSDKIDIKGVTVKNIQQAIEENDESLNKYFGKAAKSNRDAFLALNTALTEDGALIHVSDNIVVEKPIALYFINDSSESTVYSNSRNLVIAGKSSQANFLEFFLTEGNESSFSNIASEVVIDENAHIGYYRVQNNKETAYQVGTTQVHQSRSSVFSAYTFTLNGAIIRNNLNVTVDGEGCETNMYGLYLINGKTHVDNHTAVDHVQPHCESNELYKGILEDTAKGVFNGKVFVRKEAQKTNAFQSNKNILLSDTAVVNTKPQLEIWADDVKCSHGCTTGQLDEDALFYLRSRGLSKDSSRALLLYAFAIEVLETVKLDPLKNFLENLISERLHKDF
ncbi:Fe-S cluster assembly protein SufD [Fulvivirga lutea]|uniref:Fe-S cluster assembly protein SufD n=1 Tax=Fulvivirga lutea TaxID=2810512 RepID=A0A974WEC5_9BACT|nr:Fe-S cluster assembly protein SufD [Fulvivirga lutea]QSE96225.1 Fe-S cluster assembly protein SufD [Fulvivirga lutea]